ncbi:4-hydroxybenzoate octaprenyltransferase [Tropicimonas sp. IMCC34043]|uniref:4-hydroxybenzoate octaprenyltransferase n=1 Tax=Tropicimonas sp. IMCC34043 TaxID=2248760 RepID=UPI000E243653|nr:4-hydroxybenzoate octaprenyltransferase [Tropicimonas sp. IMCC34043]
MTETDPTPETTGLSAPQTGPATQADGGTVADAVTGNWVDRHAPPMLRPYLRLSRADRPVGSWGLAIPCWWGVLAAAAATGWMPFDWWILIGCGLGAVLMRGAGCTWNDITDRDIDARVERTRSRPLPSGQVSLRQALIWMAAQALVAFLILLTFNTFTIWLGIASLIPVAIYPFGKRFTWWPQLILGINFNWGVLVGWAAHTGSLDAAPLLLYFGGIAWTIFYDTIYAHQDIEDDALIGVKSTARLFGEDTPAWLELFTLTAVTMWAVGTLAATAPTGSLLKMAIGLLGVFGMGWHMRFLARNVDFGDPQSCLTAFRALRTTGMILVVALAVVILL